MYDACVLRFGAAVGRRREDEYLDGDDNQEDEPTHKGADAGHQNDNSSSCTTSGCGGYRVSEGKMKKNKEEEEKKE